jgi:predicted nucleic acid-binding protein
MRVYLDSNVFISFIKREKGKQNISLSTQTDLFFNRIKNEKNILILSELFFKEIKKIIYLEPKEIINQFKEMKILI